ncbi:ABC transporter permease [Aeromicrobium sp. A1-2]|uniref:ABC transporter permease n=1 Tax=Aeromicrobium sp. A1-2 TaxID=2107713 RepID=UPI000E524DFD|nr:ABC transporter permease [Aeromicrobium sp. A1-2]AXT86053.1 ABC transporter permease [Aeromicrobium sp. A1-2]
MTAFAGTLALLRFHLRRDRLMMLWWILGNVSIYYSQAVSVDGLYPSQAELSKAAASMEGNAAFIAMAGPARALDTIGGQVAWQSAAFGAVIAGLMSMFLIGRHTRAEEESGRDELVRAAAIGRHAPMAAAALVAFIANVLLVLLLAGSLVSYDLPVEGSIVVALAAGLAGLVFAGVALVAVQLAASTRGAYGITGAAIGIAYALRAIGDLGNGALSWLSPIGWGQYMRAYAGETWWPALLSLGAIGVLGVVAVQLFDHRDIGSGVLQARPGPSRGELGSTFALAWRLQRGSVVGWTAGLALMGVAYGSIGDSVGDLVGDSQFAADMFAQGGGSLVDSFYATTALMLGLVGAGFAISSVLRLRGEEAAYFAELLLATAVSRRSWALSQLAVTVLGTVIVLLAAGLGLGLGFGIVAGDSGAVLRLTGATVQYVVPVLLLAGVAWLAYGTRTRWGSVGWFFLGLCVVVMLFGAALRLPGWVQNVSPFHHLALLPAEDLRPMPLLVVAMLAGLAGIGGMVALERRDIG